MKRASVLKLREEVWFAPLDEHPELEVCIVPSAAGSALTAINSEDAVCRNAFVNFRGYEDDDGKPVTNNVQTRKELYAVVAIRGAINNKLMECQAEVLQGEGSAASA